MKYRERTIYNKDPDELRSYHAADLRVCFSICKNRFSNDLASIIHCFFPVMSFLTKPFHIHALTHGKSSIQTLGSHSKILRL